MQKMKLGGIVLGLLLGISVLGCGKRVPEIDLANEEPRVVLLPEQHDPVEVRAAIISAMTARNWVAEQENGTSIVGRLSHRGAVVRVDIQYATDRVTLKGLQADHAGKNYEKWLANLEASIRDALKRPAPAAAPVPAPPPPAAAAATPPPTLAIFTVPQKADKVKVMLQRALAQHSWVIEQETATGEIIARLNHRKGLVRVRISADNTQATITYVESQELNIDASGRSDDYEKWMRNLVDSIRSATRS